MRVPRIYLEHPLCAGESIDLDSESLHYLGTVLRLANGAQLRLFNGDGREFAATLQSIAKRSARVLVGETLDLPPAAPPLPVHIGIGLSRGERMDHAIQKATELGVAALTPLTLERCNAKMAGERETQRRQHWRRVAIGASEQCGRRDIPHIASPETLDAWLARRSTATGLVLHPQGAQPLNTANRPESIFLLIGPEGGLSDNELTAAFAAGFEPWWLGPRVLRTETAPVAALAVLQYVWGDLRRG